MKNKIVTDSQNLITVRDRFRCKDHQVRNRIKSSEFVIDPRQKKYLTVMNPIPPRIYGLPKEGTPLRPIVSYISSPTYRLCKHLDYWFKMTTNFRPAYSVKNTTELIDKIKNFNIPPNSILVSFDVQSLYPRVPLTPTLQRIDEILLESNISIATRNLFHFWRLACYNICKYNNEFYQFPDGLPIGSPIAGFNSRDFYGRFRETSSIRNTTSLITLSIGIGTLMMFCAYGEVVPPNSKPFWNF